ncbi:16S rRNA (adenine(1518)-N(6)/adenine(1519)-N(6))-dimethyltransferase RsmA [Sneathiella sp. P13V-1]|uniref:16S rRNA (adenine(1518)-N(6)/adenine(1519)-N(6))- dimethyltransferase RsmA n=1 Tax=Sneathiella sp. P13V-1 TaxID=2697366 RepID=UPI00187B563B|nr:16S rRNA (adenine(1518)-N(6)/adenine(1519)-N(6))-dimethyltransferase RsmA [Sneathiella sp. P13V-1]MBE7637010.1 16S rRNA (adenine(1518)-N(6)/adenine(1519)-N(6))-dimethyltransferase RsmA [Sneathiella sp. P13V-1]
MSNGENLPPLRDVINKYGLRAEKSLGQNFLLDLNLTGRIARCAGKLEGETVMEVGPGPGGLTRAILSEGAAKLVAIEKDTRCLELLAEVSADYDNRLTVLNEDALEISEEDLLGEKAHIIANLPYNVATPLLIKWLKKRHLFKSMTLMFQKEVADRIVAAPRTKAYGRLSILSQWLCDTSKQFDISPKAFTPPPKVTSTVIKLVPLEQPRYEAKQEILEKVVAAAFGQRRKMLRASLKPLGGNPEERLEKAGIKPTSRAEELGVEEFCALARAYE